MAHDVFISYASQDRHVADAVCTSLEKALIRCWIAPRDVTPGRPYAGQITRAIESSRAMVLLFSANSNVSEDVLREVQLAASASVHILNFRIEEVSASDDMEYYLSVPHWLDAITPPLEAHLARLTTALQALMPINAPLPPSAAPVEPAVPEPSDEGRQERNGPGLWKNSMEVAATGKDFASAEGEALAHSTEIGEALPERLGGDESETETPADAPRCVEPERILMVESSAEPGSAAWEIESAGDAETISVEHDHDSTLGESKPATPPAPSSERVTGGESINTEREPDDAASETEVRRFPLSRWLVPTGAFGALIWLIWLANQPGPTAIPPVSAGTPPPLAGDGHLIPPSADKGPLEVEIVKGLEAIPPPAIAPSIDLDEAQTLNARAWVFATSPEAGERNGAEAVRFALEACARSGFKKAGILDTLAAAYAEAGQWAQATAAGEAALRLATAASDTELLKELHEHLEAFQKRLPLRETAERTAGAKAMASAAVGAARKAEPGSVSPLPNEPPIPAPKIHVLPTPPFTEQLAATASAAKKRITLESLPGLRKPSFGPPPEDKPTRGKRVTLKLISTSGNQITDHEEWFTRHDLERELPVRRGDWMPAEDRRRWQQALPSEYRDMSIELVKENAFADLICANRPSGAPHLFRIARKTGAVLAAFELRHYLIPPGSPALDYPQVVQWADQDSTAIYFTNAHRGYAKVSAGQNAYLTAISSSDGTLLWRSRPLVANALTFVIEGDCIITGYGYTDEPDFLYILDRLTGAVLEQVKLKSGPDYIVRKADRIYVRTYDTDYVYRLETAK